MYPRDRLTFATFGLFLFCISFFAATGAAQSTDKFYYWVAPGTDPTTLYGREYRREEGFVVEVDAGIAARIDDWRSHGIAVKVGGVLANGSVSYNRNYFAPGHPIWNWHMSVVDYVSYADTFFGPECECMPFVGNPSDIANNMPAWDGQRYEPRFYEVKGPMDPTKMDAIANVSNRGLTGAGEKTLITGLIINGGQPRNVIVRALGPSLKAAGVQQAVSNPKIDVYFGSTKIATNADWKTDARANSLAQNYPTLAPPNDKEAALLLTLFPGSYTLQGTNEDGTEGIILLEAYDVDSAIP
jgi:hypothetical protein